MRHAFRFAAIAGVCFLITALPAAGGEPVSGLAAHTHVHGLAVDRTDPQYLFIATHHGLFRAGPDGIADRVSEVQDFMGFNADPGDTTRLYASGHPARGGNLGFIASTDGGRTWSQISPGANGPVDFHQMAVSPADPNVIYGAYGSLEMSADAGKTWEMAAALPEKLIDLAASAKDRAWLYAATEGGLSVSRDRGESWTVLFEGAPATLVETTADGTLYAFVLGTGLVRAPEQSLGFVVVSNDFGNGYLLHLAVDPTNPDRLFVATGHGAVLISSDGGKTWTGFGG